MEPELIDPEWLERLQLAFDGISERHREVIRLRRVEGLTYPEMGIRLGISMDEVEHRLALAIAALDRAMDEQERPWWRFW